MYKITKIGISALLLLCLADMPYGYFNLVRFLAPIGFGYLAYCENQEKKDSATFIYVILAILFQPIIKIGLGRTMWNVVDVVVAVGLLISLFYTKKESKNKSN